MTQEQLDSMAAEMVATGATPKGILAALDRAHNNSLNGAEEAKDHPLKTLILSDADWAALRTHMMDGGGVENRNLPLQGGPSLMQRLWIALNESDQTAFWPCFVHMIKAHAKADGLIRPLPNGGVSFGPIGSNRHRPVGLPLAITSPTIENDESGKIETPDGETK